MTDREIEQSALRGADGTIHVGYLVLFKSGRAVIIACFTLLIMGGIGIALEPKSTAAVIQATGVAIGAVLGAYGVLLGLMGAFMWGDSKQGPTVAVAVAATAPGAQANAAA